CDDGIPCTLDGCDEDEGACVSIASNGFCSDGMFCNGQEVCDLSPDAEVDADGCRPGTPPTCSDGVPCTTDVCDDDLGACRFPPDHEYCDDNDFCNGAEICDPVNDCQDGEVPDCTDAFNCTIDSCHSTLGCLHEPDDSICDNELFCDGVETCDAEAGCQPGE